MTTNKDGFKVDTNIESDDLLTHMAKVRQAEKGVIAKATPKDKLNEFLANELAIQKVRLKPLGLELLSEAIIAYFEPKKAAKKA